MKRSNLWTTTTTNRRHLSNAQGIPARCAAERIGIADLRDATIAARNQRSSLCAQVVSTDVRAKDLANANPKVASEASIRHLVRYPNPRVVRWIERGSGKV